MSPVIWEEQRHCVSKCHYYIYNSFTDIYINVIQPKIKMATIYDYL